MNFSFFAAFLKNRNIISKTKISKVTDYAAFKDKLRPNVHLSERCAEFMTQLRRLKVTVKGHGFTIDCRVLFISPLSMEGCS